MKIEQVLFWGDSKEVKSQFWVIWLAKLTKF